MNNNNTILDQDYKHANKERLYFHCNELQEKSGYYKIYPQTKIIDVTNCKNAKESAQKVLENIKEVVKSGI